MTAGAETATVREVPMTSVARRKIARTALAAAPWVLGYLVGTLSGSPAFTQSRVGSADAGKSVDTLVAKDAIREQIYNYSRGLDRMDREMTRRVWHAGGTAAYLLGPANSFKGTGAEFVEWVFKAHANITAHSHQMTNIIIGVDGDKATSETYALVSLFNDKTAGPPSTTLIRGRYQDRWSKRNGRWAIDHRQFVYDFSTVHLETGSKTPVMGTRDRTDPSYGVVPF